MHRLYIVVVALSCWSSYAADQDFYLRFLAAVQADSKHIIKRPSLVDTNNLAPKLTHATISLEGLKANGEVGSIRLGMTMEQVAACWGKPTGIWPNCYGGPRFMFKDADVIFAGSSNCVERIFLRKLPLFENPAAAPTLNELTGLLGQPESREHAYDGSVNELIYEAPGGKLMLELSSERLSFIRLERPRPPIVQKYQE
jgi:hypothetical protein